MNEELNTTLEELAILEATGWEGMRPGATTSDYFSYMNLLKLLVVMHEPHESIEVQKALLTAHLPYLNRMILDTGNMMLSHQPHIKNIADIIIKHDLLSWCLRDSSRPELFAGALLACAFLADDGVVPIQLLTISMFEQLGIKGPHLDETYAHAMTSALYGPAVWALYRDEVNSAIRFVKHLNENQVPLHTKILRITETANTLSIHLPYDL